MTAGTDKEEAEQLLPPKSSLNSKAGKFAKFFVVPERLVNIVCG